MYTSSTNHAIKLWSQLISLENFVSVISEYENDKQVGENFIDCSKGKTEFQQKKVNISWFIIHIL